MTEGVKSPKDTLFFLTPDSEEEEDRRSKKPLVAPFKNGTPIKPKTVGGKVLRNQTRRAVQDDVHQTALVKLIEHQRELHQILQSQGLAKFSEDGGGSGGKEGKGWKKFQSYKGEGALPSEIEKLRVGLFLTFSWLRSNWTIDLRWPQSANRRTSNPWLCCPLSYQHDKKC